MDATEIGWIAGFFDGEGSSYASRNGQGRYYLVLTVSQADMEPLERVRSLCGGSIYRKATGRLSKRDAWTLHIAKRDDVARFREIIYPLLCSAKRAQLDRAAALEDSNPAPIPHLERNWRRGVGSKPRRIAVGE